MMLSRSLAGLLVLASCLLAPSVGAEESFRTVPEMAPLPDYVAFPAAERRQLATSSEVAPALAAAERHVRALWPELLAELDLVALSRWHVEATRGFELPAEPSFESRVLGRDADGALHVDLRGPRLPARYDIVHRHLHLLAVVAPGGDVGQVSATIRTRVYE